MRELWAKILTSQARSDQSEVSTASMALLALLDHDLAATFEKYVQMLLAYGCFPWHAEVLFNGLDLGRLKVLEEIGFIEKSSLTAFKFREFTLMFSGGNPNLKMLHGQLVLTQRGHELAVAVFGKSPHENSFKNKFPPEAEQVKQLEHMVTAAFTCGPRPICLGFDTQQGNGHIGLKINEQMPAKRPTAEELLGKLNGQGVILSEISKKPITRLQQTFENMAVCKL